MPQPIFNVTAKDKAGKPIEFSPGKTKLVARGPMNAEGMREAFAHVEIGLRRATMERTGEDPGPFTDVEVTLAGEAPDQTRESFGLWRPAGGAPVALPSGAAADDDEPGSDD